MSKVINDYPIFAGTFGVADYIYVYLGGNAAGSRDAKVAVSALLARLPAQPLAVTTLSVSGILTPTGGIAAAAGSAVPTVFHSGNAAPDTTTTGTDTTPVVTETYIVEVFVPLNCSLTGISLLNGSAVAGNIQLALANSAGVIVAQTASTAAAGTGGYQKVPFTAPYAALGPAKYFILLQNNNVANRYRSHVLGNFGASKKTAEVYGTFTTITPPVTFTTGQGPIADTY